MDGPLPPQPWETPTQRDGIADAPDWRAPRKASRDIASACGGLSEGLNGARGTMPSPRRKIMR